MTPQNIALPNLTTSKGQWGKRNLLHDQDGYNPYPTTGTYSSPYCFTAAVIMVCPVVYHQVIPLLALSAIVELHL